MNFYRIITIVVFLFVISSCTTIEGDVDPRSTISLAGTGKARISGETNRTSNVVTNFDQHIAITALNGKSLFRLAIDNSSYPESLLIKPGNHKINVRFMHGYAYSDGVLWLNAEEEKSYVIRKKVYKYSVSFWIEDSATGEIVGGVFGEPESEEKKNVN